MSSICMIGKVVQRRRAQDSDGLVLGFGVLEVRVQ